MTVILFSLLLFFFPYSARGTTSVVPTCGRYLSGRSLAEVAVDVHGGKILKPTVKSRLGRYQAKTGAKIFLHRFPRTKGGALGSQKVVILVSESSFPDFAKLFGATFPNGFEHLHTPNQGTLMMRWMDRTVSNGRISGGDRLWRFPTHGSIGPLILLSDDEVKRLQCYFRLTERRSDLVNPTRIEGYNYPEDAYIQNCTAWLGHIPLGNNTVTKITVPGNQDGPKETHQRPRTGQLSQYNPKAVMPDRDSDRALLQQVWSQELHEPLFELLGVPLALANHTNPGWVALTLTGIVGNDRVPFVIFYTNDHTQIPQNFNPQITPVGP